jgi:hypothetical protein
MMEGRSASAVAAACQSRAVLAMKVAIAIAT